MKVSVSVTGMAEIEKSLKKLPIALRERTLERAITKAAKRGVKNAQDRVKPSDEGDEGFKPLKKQISHRKLKRSEVKQTAVGRKVRVLSFHAHLVEFGHRAVVGGTISSGSKGRVRRAVDDSRTGKGRVVGFVQPRPFFRPAYDRTAREVEPILVEELTKLVDDLGK